MQENILAVVGARNHRWAACGAQAGKEGAWDWRGCRKPAGSLHSLLFAIMLCIVWDGYGRRCEQHATIDGPLVERKQERKVRGIGEGAANQREETMEDGSLRIR